MSTKKEEKAAFKKLTKAFPDGNVSLTIFYSTWKKEQAYYATVNGFGSSIIECAKSADEAVELMIKMKGV